MMNNINSAGKNYQKALLLWSEFTGIVIGPLLIAIFLGKFLDNRFHTKHWILLVLLTLSFLFTIWLLIKRALKEYK